MNPKLLTPRRLRTSAAALLVCWAGLPAAIRAQSPSAQGSLDGLPPSMRQSLEKNATAVSAMRVEWRETKAGAALATSDYAGPRTYWTYCDGKQFYQRIEGPVLNPEREIYPYVHEDSCDGKFFYFGSPDRLHIPGVKNTPAILTKFGIHDATDPDRMSRFFESPYMEAAGYWLPSCVAELADYRSVESLVLRYASQSSSTQIEQLGDRTRLTLHIPDPILARVRAMDLNRHLQWLKSGRNSPESIAEEMETLKSLRRMEPTRAVTFVLDPKRGYGVVEREDWTAAGKRILHIVADDGRYYQQAGVWLPTRCVVSYYTYPLALTVFSEKPMFTVTLDLNQVAFGPQEASRFVLDYKEPGSLIVDRSTPEARENPYHQVSYVVAADGAALREAAARASREIAAARGNRSHGWLWANAALLTALLIFLLAYRVRKARAF